MDNPGAIVNAGNLSVKEGRSLALAGGVVINTGTINTLIPNQEMNAADKAFMMKSY
jgi:hypothetical protein